MLIIKLSGKSSGVFATIALMAEKAGKLTIEELAKLATKK